MTGGGGEERGCILCIYRHYHVSVCVLHTPHTAQHTPHTAQPIHCCPSHTQLFYHIELQDSPLLVSYHVMSVTFIDIHSVTVTVYVMLVIKSHILPLTEKHPDPFVNIQRTFFGKFLRMFFFKSLLNCWRRDDVVLHSDTCVLLRAEHYSQFSCLLTFIVLHVSWLHTHLFSIILTAHIYRVTLGDQRVEHI